MTPNQTTPFRQILGVTLDCVIGDITAQPDFDAVVNAANAELRPGGGVAGAIHRAAGPELEAECRPLAPLFPGRAVITRAHRLPNRYVIHCLGPIYGFDEPADALLAACYQNALRIADAHRLDSIAFPAISTGAFRYPMEAAARVAFRALLDHIPKLSSVMHIRFVLFDAVSHRIHLGALEQIPQRFGG
jgi:O-acetyl-ADP-ribose deacetylase